MFLPRQSTRNRDPTSVRSVGRYPRPRFFPTVGQGLPLVQMPISFVSSRSGIAVARDAVADHLEADELAGQGRSLDFSSAARPTKSPFCSFTTQPRPASMGLVVSSMSLP